MTAQPRTGKPMELMQDECSGLSKWFASRPDARRRVREACAEIRERRMLTPREHDVLDAIRKHQQTWKEPPTRVELGKALGIAAPTVELHLQRLAAKKVLRLEKRWRGITLLRSE